MCFLMSAWLTVFRKVSQISPIESYYILSEAKLQESASHNSRGLTRRITRHITG